ncbi:MAG: hypothetical protein HZB91_06195 [Elusimicrobia bacterium]|nr:hypothetical protein [Elusimicrobiota bacterium]
MPEDSSEAAELDDIERIVASLNKNGVDFMIIGGYAVISLYLCRIPHPFAGAEETPLRKIRGENCSV